MVLMVEIYGGNSSLNPNPGIDRILSGLHLLHP